MLKAYKYRVYPNNEQKMQIAKHLDAVVLYITRHLHIKKIHMSRKRNLSAKRIVIITVTEN